MPAIHRRAMLGALLGGAVVATVGSSLLARPAAVKMPALEGYRGRRQCRDFSDPKEISVSPAGAADRCDAVGMAAASCAGR
jgi:hypothetical protein